MGLKEAGVRGSLRNVSVGASVIPDSGISRWTFDDADTSGSTATDVWGTNDATIAGATTGVTGELGEAYSFDGIDDYIDTGYAFSENAGSVSIWIKNTDDSGRICSTVGGNDSASPLQDGQIQIVLLSDGTILFQIRANSSNNSITSSTTIDDGNWHQLVLTYAQNDEIEGYIDGSSVGSTTLPSFSANNGQDLWIMRYTRDQEFYLPGDVDDPRLYSKKLTGTEVSNLYTNGSI